MRASLRSPHAHAEIVRIDTERARRLPGVEAILTARDVPGENTYGRKVKDQPVLAEARVRQVGDPVALVVATSPEVAAAALPLIEVEYRPLPAVFTPDDALADGAPQIDPEGNLLAENWLRSGDIAEGFARADVVVENTYTTPWNEHAYLEPEAALALWDGDTLVVRTSTQYSHYHRAEVARTLALPVERVRVIPTVSGGAFGGKTDISCQCLVALAAHRTGRPVRIVYSRAESFASTTKRHPYRIRVRSGATRDGDLTALQVDMLADTGAYASFGPGLMVKTFASATGPYRWPHVELHGRVVFTNNPTAGCMRGPGTTQVAFAIESQMDQLAARLGMDPLEFRERNRLRQGDRLMSGQVLERDPAFGATLEAVRPHWVEALERCAESADQAGTRRRGVGVASIWYGIGGGGGGPTPGQDPALTVGRGPGRAALDLLPDGSIVLRTGAADLGQGTATALGLIAAEELGVPFELVTVQLGDTATCPDAGPAVGSRVTFFVGNAVKMRGGRSPGGDPGHRRRPAGAADRRARSPRRARPGPRGGRGRRRARRDRPGKGRREAREQLRRLLRRRRSRIQAEHRARRALRDVRDRLRRWRRSRSTWRRERSRSCAWWPPTTWAGRRSWRVSSGRSRAGSPWELASPSPRSSSRARPAASSSTGSRERGTCPRWSRSSSAGTADAGPPELQLKGVAECSNMVVAPAIANAIAHATGQRVVDLPVRLPRRD